MAIDRYEDDSSAAAMRPDEAGNYSVKGREAEMIAADEIPAREVRQDSPDASEEPPDSGFGTIDGEDRAAYHLRYREVVEAEFLAADRERWDAAKPGLEAEWRECARRYPATADVSPALDDAAIEKIKKGCDRIAETEENIVTPTMLRIEAADPERHLVGLEHCRKGQDRIMEKVVHDVQYKGRTAEDALANLKDPIRYTFQYTDTRYTAGVNADIERLKAAGFALVELRNSWGSADYKGINSRWRTAEDGQLFEVQFHTRVSFEVKQLTHHAYEQLRVASITKAEQVELVNFQQRANGYVSIPERAHDIQDYP
jgi:hypothetical protein